MEADGKKSDLLFPELSYKIIGCAFKTHSLFGSGHKESLYQEAFEDELQNAGLKYRREPELTVTNPETGKILKSRYRPDFLIDDKIVVELKAVVKLPNLLIDQLYDYIKNSAYEVGFLFNFAEESLKPIRLIYGNHRKTYLHKSASNPHH